LAFKVSIIALNMMTFLQFCGLQPKFLQTNYTSAFILAQPVLEKKIAIFIKQIQSQKLS